VIEIPATKFGLDLEKYIQLGQDRPPGGEPFPEWFRHDGGWYEADGNNTRLCVWPLDGDSVVFEIGACQGHWAKRMVDLYHCTIYCFEPAMDAFEIAREKLVGHGGIRMCNFGLGRTNGQCLLGKSNQYGGSVLSREPELTTIEMRDMVGFLDDNKIENIDLASLNIEGGEFDLIPYMIETGTVRVIQHLMIQWHLSMFLHSSQAQFGIWKELTKMHTMIWNYGAWETWKRKC